MNFSKNFNKKASLLLIFSLFFFGAVFFTAPQKASAQFTVATPDADAFLGIIQGSNAAIVGSQATQLTTPSVWNVLQTDGVDPFLQASAKLWAEQVIQDITQATVVWINNGFNGQPTYVSDLGDFLANTADQTVGQMLQSSALGFLCQPFQLQVKQALNIAYSQPFYKQITCTLTGAIANATNAANSFTSAGGWNNWLQITTQPQNNAVGAFLIVKAQTDAQIVTNQNSAASQLNYGQGALSYQTCDEITTDANGNQIGATQSIVWTPTTKITQPTTPGETTSVKNCTVKTPGAIITAQLAAKVNSPQTQLDLQASLSNGIDQVLSSLGSELTKLAVSQLTNGVIGSNNTANTNYENYNTAISTALQQAQSSYNQQETSAQTDLNQIPLELQNQNYTTDYSSFNNAANQAANYDDAFGSDYGSGLNTITAPPVESSSTSVNGVQLNISDPFYTQKTNSLSVINTILNYEGQYQNADAQALNILEAGRGVFANAQACNLGLGDSISYSRAIQINENVISNLDQTNNPGRTVPQISSSLPVVENAITLSNAHVATLNAAESTIAAATSSEAITLVMNGINGTNFNADEPTVSLVSGIQSWLTSMGTMYTTASCPIDLSAALAGVAPQASSTVSTGSPN